MHAVPPIPVLMGVVNATPDSFSERRRFVDAEDAATHALTLVAAGADIIDVGGESTRPGAADVPIAEELRRVVPVIEAIESRSSVRLSIDTRKPEIARAAVAAGASIWNDVSALTYSPESLETAATLGCSVVLMHAKGEPATMQNQPRYEDVVKEVFEFLAERMAACEAAGIHRDRIIIDPGIGFGKTVEHNLTLLARLSLLRALGVPIMLGVSRKSFIGRIDEGAGAHQRLPGSLAAALEGWRQGASLLRVHDVAETRQALRVAAAVAAAGQKDA